MDGDAAADGRVGGEDDGGRAHGALVGLHDDAVVFLGCAFDGGPGEQAAAILRNRFRQSREIFQRMEASLIGETERAYPIVRVQRGRLARVDHRHADLRAGGKLVIELGGGGAGRQQEVAVEPAEIACNAFARLNLFDPAYGRRLALIDRPRHFEPARAHEVGISVVERGDEMSGGARRHSHPDPAAIEHNDRTSAGNHLVGRGEPGNAGTDDGHIGALVAVEGRRVGDGNIHPRRLGFFFGDVHGRFP
jgi:hypothetical protein